MSVTGRSLLDPIRVRWGGLSCVVFGASALFSGQAAGIFFGVLGVVLGLATWFLTDFGRTPFASLSPTVKGIAFTGSLVGWIFLLMFFLVGFIIFWAIKAFADSR